MKIKAIKTQPVQIGDSLVALLDDALPPLQEKSIVIITSKIVSLCQERAVLKGAARKEDLIQQEADAILEDKDNPYNIHLTLTHNMLIPSAGIDESNGNGFYVLYPKAPQKTATEIWQYLRQKHQLKNLGILITDSHTTPLRRGVMGITLGWCGLKPLFDYAGKPDIFGEKLRITQINVIDSLATCATLVMGEGSESTPLAIIEEAPKVSFLNRPPTAQEEKDVHITLDDDLYGPLLRQANWTFPVT